MPDANATLRSIFVTGLRNAHAVENQALALMDRQIEHLANYEEVEARLRSHRVETEGQIVRLETILSELGESPSALKDLALSLSGNMAAMGHMIAGDEILKNSYANVAFENFEASAYKSLIVMAEDVGFASAAPLLRETLQEELSMADYMAEMIPVVTRRFLSLSAADATASH